MRDYTIGIVSEGPRDADVIEALITELVPGNHFFLRIQPEMSETLGFGNNGGAGALGAGWKGVLNWCNMIAADIGIEAFISAGQKLDMLVVHLDTDVAREPEVNCAAPSPPITDTIENLAEHLNNQLRLATMLPQIVYCIPADNFEAWILCAFDPATPLHDPANQKLLECFPKPDYEISKPDYNRPERLLKRKSNGKPDKNKRVYNDKLIPKIIQEWAIVKQICPQAEVFEKDVRQALIQ